MEFIVRSSEREEIIDITEKVEGALEKEKKARGKAVLVYCPHTTCSIIINEISNKDVCEDILNFLRKEIPQGGWKHNCQEKNGDSHIKASLLGNCKVIPFEQGKLKLGTWQKIGLIELDGARERKVIVEIL